MPYQAQVLPLDIATIIIDYVADDTATLKNIALTSQVFCALAQEHIFSTVLLDRNANSERVIFFENLLRGDHGAIIVGYIKNLYLLFCDDWFAEEEGVEVDDPVHFGTMIEFIAEHARRLRRIHIGPFIEIHLDWHDISHNVRNAITHLLISVEEIALEKFVNIPLALFQNLQNVKSLDVGHVISTLSTYTPPHPPHPPIPSPTSLAIHPGIDGFSIDLDGVWDMTSFLRNITLGMYLNFSNLTTLYLHLLDDPNRNTIIKQILQSCANTLCTLRLYLWGQHSYDSNMIDFSQLPALQSLTLVTDFQGAGSSMQYLSEAINTMDTKQIHLKDIRLAIDTEDRFRDWTMGLALMQTTPGPWEDLLRTNVSRILWGSNARVALALPPWPRSSRTALQCEQVFTAMSDILGIEEMESTVRARLTVAIQEVSIRYAFTLRTEAEIQSVNE